MHPTKTVTVDVLASLLKAPPKSIEILPGDGPEWSDPSSSTYPYLLQQGNLGIPLKALHRAYMIASSSYQETKQSSVRSTEALIDSTGVILLANPAHQTALNSRKRLVLDGELDAISELTFSASLLSCRECTKESILWYHRRWLLRRIHGDTVQTHKNEVPSEIPCLQISSEIANEEFAIISRACELYPRNYHAWTHRYFCMMSLSLSANSSPVDPESARSVTALMSEYHFMLCWIDRHISDYSAMQYMCRLEQTIRSLSLTPPALSIPLPETIPPYTQARSLLRSYPDHESLWVYLRGTSSKTESPDLTDFLALTDGRPNVSSYVLRYLAWTAHTVGVFHVMLRASFTSGPSWVLSSFPGPSQERSSAETAQTQPVGGCEHLWKVVIASYQQCSNFHSQLFALIVYTRFPGLQIDGIELRNAKG